jgi:hypothetical protein
MRRGSQPRRLLSAVCMTTIPILQERQARLEANICILQAVPSYYHVSAIMSCEGCDVGR